MLVKIGVYTNVRGSHHFLSKFFYFFDSPWSSPLESNPMDSLVYVDGVLASHNFIDG